ncbi:hypothetical protein D3C84_1037010 [compost metagenome]
MEAIAASLFIIITHDVPFHANLRKPHANNDDASQSIAYEINSFRENAAHDRKTQ